MQTFDDGMIPSGGLRYARWLRASSSRLLLRQVGISGVERPHPRRIMPGGSEESARQQRRAEMVVEKEALFEEARPMSRTQGQDVSGESRRPLLTDAPDWFNRARSRANRQPAFRTLVYLPRQVPLPTRSSPNRSSLADLWKGNPKVLLCALFATALPIVFAMGFWTRGLVSPVVGETASEGAGGLQAAVAARQAAEDESREPAAVKDEEPAVAQSTAETPSRPDKAAAVEDRDAPPDVAPAVMPAQMARGTRGAEGAGALIVNGGQTDDVRLDQEKPSNPGQDFLLPTAGGVRHVSAEVIRPVRAWFATATKEDECTTGTCTAPVARLDRKLNTALEWSSSPQAAAEQAGREGKLVFLIHVSGNFAQPGFT
jgi:hypothetical protein